MKVTVGDVTNNKCNVRDYMSYDEDTGRIYVKGEAIDTVLIDKSEEWDKLQSTIDDLSMAHDNLQRELSDIKRLMGKDKHALIKSNIALTSKVNRLEDDLVEQMECFEELQNNHIRVSNQNKRYREVLEFYADRENYKPDHYDPNIHEYMSVIDYDEGATARQALEGEE